MTNSPSGTPRIVGVRTETAMSPEFSRGLLQAISNTDVSVLYHDLSNTVVWSLNVPTPWLESPFQAEGATSPLTEEGSAQLAEARRAVLETGTPQTLELQIQDGAGMRCFDIWIDADRDEQGQIMGLVTTAVETTDHKRREQTLRALLREVSHRSKNLLAIILSIASQTGRYSGTIDTFLARFRGRIQSLASSQDLVTLSNWRGADLHQLARNQIGRYCADPDRNILISGDSPYLSPNAALHIGLALHELAVNSVSYGALTHAVGQVCIDAHAVPDGLQITWTEDFPVRQKAGGEKRFGSVALERVVPAALDGSAALELDEKHVQYRLFVPAANYELV